tara:strand:+ start:313 stop:534 length:222 start_codon:yes stop_codon:yes gene_type:complete
LTSTNPLFIIRKRRNDMDIYEKHITNRLDKLDDRKLALYLDCAKGILSDRPDDRIYKVAVRVTQQLMEKRNIK